MVRTAVQAITLLGACDTANGTWSIILVDTRTGEVAIGSATCLTGFDLKAHTPVLLTGIGGATAQSAVDLTGQNRVFIRDLMLLGTSPASIITGLAGFDAGHQSRQYGIIDTRAGGRATSFTGSGAGQYRGGRTGRFVGAGITGGDIVYAIQGNVLTGPPVIDAAVAAVGATAGDLAAKLMAGMEAAREMGGDGRCSCGPGDPTGCGSPPADFPKSAHIAYMLVARVGDRNGSNGVYRVGTTSQATTAADLNADGKPDLITCNMGASSISVSLNQTVGSTEGVPMFSPTPTNFTVASSPRDLVAADFSGDGLMDIAVVNYVSDNLSVLQGRGDGTLMTRVNFALGDGPSALIAGDFDRDGDTDLAIANQLASSVTIMANNGAGVFSSVQTVPSGSAPAAITAADLDGDGDLDLVVGASGDNAVAVLRNITVIGGAANFFLAASIPAGRGITGVVAADFNGDDRIDIAASAATDNRLNVLLQNAAGSWSQTSQATFSPGPLGVRAQDVTGDGVPDLVSVSRNTAASQLGVFAGIGDGTFSPLRSFAIGFQPGRFTLADLNGDGDLDAAIPVTVTGGNSVMVMENLNVPVDAGDDWNGFNNGIGCATGDYFLDFNVANQQQSDPDPVFTLRARYDAWRGETAGHPDAIRTRVVFDHGALPADGQSTTRMTILPRDWRDVPVVLPIGLVEVVQAPGSDGVSTLGPVTANADGTFSLTVTAGTALGTDEFVIRLQDTQGGRAVVLMPPPSFGTFTLDWDDNGELNSEDFFGFLGDYLVGNADINRDGVTDSRDFFDFVAAFFR
ncbi:MAG: VCBS repeat-containing protein [Pyrinomonadaceae bacterium]|nr:VCBS repeat-containing protein [Phycisphaerales bacterium]